MLDVSPTGALLIKNGGGTLKATGATALSAGTWYRVEALFTSGQATVRVFAVATGALVQTMGPVAVSAGVATRLRVGSVTVGGPVLVDRVQIADGWVTPVPTPSPSPSPPPSPSPCGSLAGTYDPASPPRYEHVVVIMEENWSYHDFVASKAAPYLTSLNAGCGAETNFHAATHPSQPNYMAATSGIASTMGARTSADNIFHQAEVAGLSWKSYQESMPTPCSGTQTSVYKAGHNPAFYYDNLRTPANTCALRDVPLSPALDDDIAADTLPSYTWITPNECHIFYWVTGCTTPQSALKAEGDKWLSALIPRLTAMPSYRAGTTLILVTFDEGRESSNESYVDCTDAVYYVGHPDCQVPTVVVSPYIAPGTTDASDQNLYSLLGTTEDILGVPRLARAIGQPSMRATMPF
jgi:phospholipase C